MPKRTVDVYEVVVKFSILKKYWREAEGLPKISTEILADKIQQGIELPIDIDEITLME